MKEVKVGSRVQYRPVPHLEPTIRFGTVRTVNTEEKQVFLHGYMFPFYLGCITVVS